MMVQPIYSPTSSRNDKEREQIAISVKALVPNGREREGREKEKQEKRGGQ
jgi:hypothetical protein